MDAALLVAIAFFIVSVVLAAIDNQWRSALLFAVWSILVYVVLRGLS